MPAVAAMPPCGLLRDVGESPGQCAHGGASLTAETCAENYEGDQSTEHDEHNDYAYYPRSNALSSLSSPRIVISIGVLAHDL